MIAITVIGIVAPFIGIITFQIFQERKENKKYAYKKWYTKQIMKHPELRLPAKDLKNVITSNEGAPGPDKAPSIMSLLGNLDSDKIKQVLGILQDEDIEIESYGDSLTDRLLGFAKDNPEIAGRVLDTVLGKVGGKKQQEEEVHFLGE